LFELVCLGKVANPTVVLEEVDKAKHHSNDDPLGCLHTLLEPSTSGAVRDLSIDFVFDASLVTFIATANDPTKLPQSLRSRFYEFFIRFPEAHHAIDIATSVAEAVILEIAPYGFSAPTRKISVLLAHLTPREVVKAVKEGIANAILNGRLHLVCTDFSPETLGLPGSGSRLH